MVIVFPNTKKGIKEYITIKKTIMIDKQINPCYNNYTIKKGDMRNGKDYQGSE